ncbi:helix-turn-helix domain-containing protein [Streptomyces sp. NPDC001833]|uniref:AraC-like ligand-binding domain-containing protein n=1 Tax=Streptomyces sp. NPDC001833 TaxID=3154658 RepID=UPI003332853C
MIVTLRTEDLPVADRFPWWCEQMAQDVVPSMVSSPHADDFRSEVTVAELGPVVLTALDYPEMRSVRTSALVRRSDPERYGLSIVMANELYFAQGDNEARLTAGQLLLHDTSQPFETRALPGVGRGELVMLQLPRTALPLRPERLNPLLARGMSGATGMSAVFARYLVGVAGVVRRGEVGEREVRRLGEVALDLAAATLASYVDAEDRLLPETRRQALLVRIEAFIELNLADPELTPAVVAAHHHISLGYLHRLFQHRELTVAAWIRHLRLERTRADLADPRLRHHPVHALGARWGFHHAADFSRAFRTAHGVPPGDYRRQVLAAGGTAVDAASMNR